MSRHPKVWAAGLAREFGVAEVARGCAGLLAGRAGTGPPSREELIDTIGPPGRYYLERERQGDPEPDYWERTWGARGLLYVWADDLEPAVVAGLDDPHWRVREMCAKVVAAHELGAAADTLAALLADAVPRVRRAAVRALAGVAESEHLAALRDAAEDPDPDVADAAERSYADAVVRLDRPDLERGAAR